MLPLFSLLIVKGDKLGFSEKVRKGFPPSIFPLESIRKEKWKSFFFFWNVLMFVALECKGSEIRRICAKLKFDVFMVCVCETRVEEARYYLEK